MKDHHETRACGCVLLHRRVYVCEQHAEMPEALRDHISEMVSRTVGEEIEASVASERERSADLLRRALAALELHALRDPQADAALRDVHERLVQYAP